MFVKHLLFFKHLREKRLMIKMKTRASDTDLLIRITQLIIKCEEAVDFYAVLVLQDFLKDKLIDRNFVG